MKVPEDKAMPVVLKKIDAPAPAGALRLVSGVDLSTVNVTVVTVRPSTVPRKSFACVAT